MTDIPIRDAATIIVLRDRHNAPSVLMGQRGASAAFMPSKFVFPGGAVDPVDGAVPVRGSLHTLCDARLGEASALPASHLAAAAIRELYEETGQILGAKSDWQNAPKGWRGYARSGHMPTLDGLQFIFRAATPKGRTRRFDARFFLVEADRLSSDPDDFSGAEDELSHLQWIPLGRAREFDLPFITEMVLAELAANLHISGPPPTVPYFRNDDEAHTVVRLAGKSPLDDYSDSISRRPKS